MPFLIWVFYLENKDILNFKYILTPKNGRRMEGINCVYLVLGITIQGVVYMLQTPQHVV